MYIFNLLSQDYPPAGRDIITCYLGNTIAKEKQNSFCVAWVTGEGIGFTNILCMLSLIILISNFLSCRAPMCAAPSLIPRSFVHEWKEPGNEAPPFSSFICNRIHLKLYTYFHGNLPNYLGSYYGTSLVRLTQNTTVFQWLLSWLLHK